MNTNPFTSHHRDYTKWCFKSYDSESTQHLKYIFLENTRLVSHDIMFDSSLTLNSAFRYDSLGLPLENITVNPLIVFVFEGLQSEFLLSKNKYINNNNICII